MNNQKSNEIILVTDSLYKYGRSHIVEGDCERLKLIYSNMLQLAID